MMFLLKASSWRGGQEARVSQPHPVPQEIFSRRKVKPTDHSHQSYLRTRSLFSKAYQHPHEGKWVDALELTLSPSVPLSISDSPLVCSLHLPNLISLPRDSTSLASHKNNLLLL